MHRKFLLIAALLAAISVALGAFAAHGLKQIVEEETVKIFQTGVQYQMYHSLALLLTAILLEKFPAKPLLYAGWFFIAGIFLFSGSLYLLTLLKITDTAGLSKIGLITPFGGLSFIIGWLCFFVSFWRIK
jgi:uncharacterized membrane protein YgdD (TMEM256/DUF423 family)